MANKKTEDNFSSWGLGNFIAVIILSGLMIIVGTLLGSYVQNKKSQEQVAGEFNFNPVVEKVISYEGQDDKTALEILKNTHQIESQDSSIGVFVTGIDEIKNQENKFWMFYVDGKLASTSADKYQTKAGEKIEWRYESLQ